MKKKRRIEQNTDSGERKKIYEAIIMEVEAARGAKLNNK